MIPIKDMPPTPQCADPKLIEALSQVRSMAGDIGEIKESMREMARAVTKLAVVEERQTQDRGHIERLFKLSDEHEGRIGALEKAQPLQQQTSAWVNKGITVLITAVLTAVLGLVLVKTGVQVSPPTFVSPR